MNNNTKREFSMEGHPQGFAYKLSNFLVAGARDRKSAKAIVESTSTEIRKAQDEFRQASVHACEASNSLNELRLKAEVEQIQPIKSAYILLGQQTRMVPKTRLDQPPMPHMPTSPSVPEISGNLTRMLTGVLMGALVGGLCGFAASQAGLLSASVAALPAVVLALVGMLLTGAQEGRQHFELSDRFARNGQAFISELNVQQAQIRQIHQHADTMSSVILRLGAELTSTSGSMHGVVADAANAAVLLKDILRMPLLNEEGALLEHVVEQLRDRAESIDAFTRKIADVA